MTSVDELEKKNLVSVKKIHSSSSFWNLSTNTPTPVIQRHLEAFCSICALPGREDKLLLQKQHVAVLARSLSLSSLSQEN